MSNSINLTKPYLRLSCKYVDLSYLVSLNTTTTKEIILGTDNGQLDEIVVDEKDKREKYIKFLFELTELPEGFMGLQVFLYSM